MISDDVRGDDGGCRRSEDVSFEPFFFDPIHLFVGEEEVAEDVGVSLIHEDVVEEGGDVRHESDGVFTEIVEDLGEGVHQIWAAEQLFIEADAADGSSGVMADAGLSLLFNDVKGKVPKGLLWVDGMVGVVDIDGVAFFFEFPDLSEDAGLSWRITPETWNHSF